MKQIVGEKLGKLFGFKVKEKFIDIILYKDYSDHEDFTTYNTSWNNVGFAHISYWTDFKAFYKSGICLCLN